MLLIPNAKYKWAYAAYGKIQNTNDLLLQGKGSQIQINNKTIIEFGSRRI